MASAACASANLALSPEPAFPAFGWLSPRISFSRDVADEPKQDNEVAEQDEPAPEKPLPEATAPGGAKDLFDFEFRLHDSSAAMLPADELFSDGKLVPLHLAPARPSHAAAQQQPEEIRSPETVKPVRRRTEIAVSDAYAVSPKAPRCSSRWRELLGLKRLQNSKAAASKSPNPNPSSNLSSNPRSLKLFLYRNPRSGSGDSTLIFPLLRDSDSESVSLSSSRLSLSSSSSSGPDHEDLPRLSLDSEKPANVSHVPLSLSRHPPRVRLARPRPTVDAAAGRSSRSPMRRAEAAPAPPHGTSVDSPRMNSSGRVVFQGLERSSSSPGSFNGGPRVKHRGMERSYSANVVRVAPVLNVPVCSLRGSSKSVSGFGFGQLFSPQKKDREAAQLSARSGAAASKRLISGI